MGTKFRSTRCDESTNCPVAFFASHPDAVQLDSAPAKQQPRDFASDERTHPASRTVKIEGRKRGFDAVNIHSRKKGEVRWKLITVRKRKFRYYDESPLAVANTPEVREYVAHGVVDDEEVGAPSEIKEVVFAG